MRAALKEIKSVVAMFVAVIMVISSVSIAYAAEDTNRSVDTIINQINEEYGLNIHVLSSEELAKYGLPEEPRVIKEDIDLDAFEKELRHIAENEIPRFERDTQAAIEKERMISYAEPCEEGTSNSAKASPVTATKAINYATAGAVAYKSTNAYGSAIWGSVVSVTCSTNIYQPRWFMALNPTVTKIDAGRTLYWKGTGDYGAYIDGVQCYLSSGTQYAEMYVRNY